MIFQGYNGVWVFLDPASWVKVGGNVSRGEENWKIWLFRPLLGGLAVVCSCECCGFMVVT